VTPVPPSVEVEGEAGVAASGGPPERPFSWKKFLWTMTPLTLIGVLILLEVPLCPSRTVLGVPCPGCGLTRATEAMLVGDFGAMLRLHPLAPILTPLALFSVIRVTLISAGALKNRNDPLGRLPNWFWGTFAILLVGLWVARMVGLFGGLPDPLDFTQGLLYRGAHLLWVFVTGG
jgi:hypothetical protein